ncbi:MAG TPA: biopolymer transporter ExbD [Candidatus Baltobacteraceae bacterium]|jgi:biopolymer transport protein ExbD|nr:biopolymer transporter ExbD [Candidatus Baltobacteraceae bacterium]
MKRFSQRNSLVTLNEINITPLLDLAFVLLIIFIITRPLIEQNIDLQLPQNMGKPDARTIDRHDIRMVEINQRGEYWLQGRRLTLPQLEAELVRTHQQNPKLIVDIRADKRSQWEYGIAVIDACLRNHITQFSVRTAPSQHP